MNDGQALGPYDDYDDIYQPLALSPGEHVLVLDDVLATGGTAAAAALLLERLGATLAGYSFLLELSFLDGRAKLGDALIESVIEVGG